MPTFTQDIDDIRRRAAQKIEEGPVTGGYRGDVEKTVALLNDALATEIVCVLRYMHHYFMATGVHASAVRDEFKEHADNEREHADAIAERIQQLGGKPDFNPRTLLQRSASQYIEGENLADMIRQDLIAERIVIEIYQDMIRFLGSDDPTTRHMFEEILADEEEHASDLTDLLYIVEPSTGKTEGQDPGTDPLRMTAQGPTKEQRSDGKTAAGTGTSSIPRETFAPGASASPPPNLRPKGGKQDGSKKQQQAGTKIQEKSMGSNKKRDANDNSAAARNTDANTRLTARSDDAGRPQSAGRGQRNRNLPGPSDTEGGELHSGQQLGTSKAVRVTQPKNKKRVA